MARGVKHLSALERSVVTDCAHGRPWREAAAILAQKFNIHITYRTVGNNVTRWERSHTLERKKGTGPPRKLTARHERLLCHMARSERRATASELVHQGAFAVSRWTAARVLRRKGLPRRRPRRVPYRTKLAKEKRLAFAKTHKDWTAQNWGKVIFLDEMAVERFRSKRRGVWRARGERGRED